MKNDRADELIERYIELHPDRPNKANARLKNSKVAVWALSGYFQDGRSGIAQAAIDYDLPCEAVEAAFEFYKRFKAIIDDRVAANAL